ncbi:LysR substrate-binding domain-containing protein [Klebsiella pneumoniae]|nr:LysR substrate-binding domain-containing protein [Klebsiella pneumoniae]
MRDALFDLCRRFADAHVDSSGVAVTPVPGITLVRALHPGDLQAAIARPLVAMLLQGRKSVTTGLASFDYGPGEAMVIAADVPTTSQITEASQRFPYYALVLELILCSSDNVEDIIQEGFDCVIRTGRIEDSTTLVARPLARYRWMVLASPAWLAAHGRPQSIDELHQHRAVGYLNHRTGRTIDWLFSLDEGDYAIRMRETLVVDDTDAYIQAGIQGLGLIRVASYLAQPYLQSGALVACLEQAASDLPLSLVYPQNRYLPPAVRAFYDWSRRVLQPPNSEA